MFRVLEAVGMLAPVIGIVLMIVYWRRSKTGFAWGLAGAVVALIASVVGFLGPRQSLLGSSEVSGESVLSNMHSWVIVRVVLLVISVILLVIGTYEGRSGTRVPVRWLAAGVPMVMLGFALSLVHVDLGRSHEGLSEVLGLLLEVAQFALLGLGVLLLCIAVVSDRANTDGRGEPVAAIAKVAMQAKQFYDRSHDRRR